MPYLILLLGVFCSLPVYACNCPEKPHIDSAIGSSDLIVTGKIIEKETVKILREFPLWTIDPDSSIFEESPFKGYINKYTVVVDQGLYGRKRKSTIIVYSETTSSACGYLFSIGDKYILYAYLIEFKDKNMRCRDVYFTDACTRTDVYTEAEEKELKKRLRR